MRILLLPHNKGDGATLRSLYEKAVTEATELAVLSAHLTEWPIAKRLSTHCNDVTFLVGTDFGLTRKDACRSVLAWLPKTHKHNFLAADRIAGFHPKVLMWRDRLGHRNLVLGSSNLTRAAFSENHEANVLLRPSRAQYEAVRRWVAVIRAGSSPISDDWLTRYKETPAPAGRRGAGDAPGPQKPAGTVRLPVGRYLDKPIRERRQGLRGFNGQKRNRIVQLIRACASGRMRPRDFYKLMYVWWREPGSSVQGTVWTIACKKANWREVCRGLTQVLDAARTADQSQLDGMVRGLMDDLAAAGNPARGAWMTELLCRFFPRQYPLWNTPVDAWLRHIHYRPQRGSSEGSKYIDLAVKLRHAMKRNRSNTAKDLMELDGAIWRWYANNY